MELRWRVEFHLYSVAWLVKVHASSGFDDFEDDPPAP